MMRAGAGAALLALSSSWAVGWSVAFHLANDHHHDGNSPDHDGALGFEMVLHGHGHPEGTPAHKHPVVGSVAMAVPGKQLVLVSAMIGDAPEVVCGETSGHRLRLQHGPTHDPPSRLQAVSVLRI